MIVPDIRAADAGGCQATLTPFGRCAMEGERSSTERGMILNGGGIVRGDQVHGVESLQLALEASCTIPTHRMADTNRIGLDRFQVILSFSARPSRHAS